MVRHAENMTKTCKGWRRLVLWGIDIKGLRKKRLGEKGIMRTENIFPVDVDMCLEIQDSACPNKAQ